MRKPKKVAADDLFVPNTNALEFSGALVQDDGRSGGREGRNRQARRAAGDPALRAGDLRKDQGDRAGRWRRLGTARASLARLRSARTNPLSRWGRRAGAALPRLPGKHQALNAALAVAMLRHQSTIPVPPSALTAAMGGPIGRPVCSNCMADRCSRCCRRAASYGSTVVITQAPPGWCRIMPRQHWNDDLPLVLLFASLTSKDAAGTLRPFKGVADRSVEPPIDGHECRSPRNSPTSPKSWACPAREKPAWPAP